MNLLTPLGLLALAGLAVLILIYILKPNYQQKVISTTYVWRVSLKYKRKKLPISKFRHILLLICQLLIVGACAFLLTQPFIPAEVETVRPEKIIILDASASMRATDDSGATRFDRAVAGARELSESVLRETGGSVSVILAAETPTVMIERAGRDASAVVSDVFDELSSDDGNMCTYGAVDMDGAMALAETIVELSPHAEIVLFTDATYIDTGGATVMKINGATEWNAAVLGCEAVSEENQYIFNIDVASYGRSSNLHVFCELTGVNAEKRTVVLNGVVECTDDSTMRLRILPPDYDAAYEENVVDIRSEMAIYSYETARVFFENIHDSLSCDNEFILYGGTKPVLRVQYSSSNANPFFSGVLMGQRGVLGSKWDLDFVEVQNGKPALEGFDFYIFEHTMPATVPTDGIVMFVSPENAMPNGSGITMSGRKVRGESLILERGARHPVTDYIPLKEFYVSEYYRLAVADGYDELLYCNGDPVLLCRNEENFKSIVMLFSVNMSHAPVLVDFPMIIGNLFEYMLPSITDGKLLYDVGETATIKARGTSVSMTAVGAAASVNERFTEFPKQHKFTLPGPYTLTQPILGNETNCVKYSTTNLFVKIPSAESNTCAVFDSLAAVKRSRTTQAADKDLVLYVAIALMALLLAERLLQSFERN